MWKSLLGRNDSPQVLESLDLPGIAKYIKSDACKNIFVMVSSVSNADSFVPNQSILTVLLQAGAGIRYIILIYYRYTDRQLPGFQE